MPEPRGRRKRGEVAVVSLSVPVRPRSRRSRCVAGCLDGPASRPRGASGSPSPTPMATRPCSGVDVEVGRGERVASSGPTAPARPRSCCISTASTWRTRLGAGRGLPVTKDNLKEIRRRVGIVFQDPDDQLFMPTVRDDVAFGPANMGLRGDELDACVDEALDAVGWRTFMDRPPHHLVLDSDGGSRSRRCWPWNRRSWCWMSPRPTSTRRDVASWPRSCLARHDELHGDPRPAVRAAAVPVCRRAQRGACRGRRRDLATSSPIAPRWRPTVWSCRTASTPSWRPRRRRSVVQ